MEPDEVENEDRRRRAHMVPGSMPSIVTFIFVLQYVITPVYRNIQADCRV